MVRMRSKLFPRSSKSRSTNSSFFALDYPKSFRLTSKITLRRPRFDAPYLPISVVHMLISRQSAMARAKREVVCSKVILCSPLSLESVPSISKTSTEPSGFLAIQIPLVVCPRPYEESMTWKPVSNNRFRRVPKDIQTLSTLLFPLDWAPITATVWYLVPRLYKSFSFRYFSKPGLG